MNAFSTEVWRTQSWFSLCPPNLCAESSPRWFMGGEQVRKEQGAFQEPGHPAANLCPTWDKDLQRTVHGPDARPMLEIEAPHNIAGPWKP